MMLIGLVLIFCFAPALLILVALLWFWLGQKIFGCIFGGG